MSPREGSVFCRDPQGPMRPYPKPSSESRAFSGLTSGSLQIAPCWHLSRDVAGQLFFRLFLSDDGLVFPLSIMIVSLDSPL